MKLEPLKSNRFYHFFNRGNNKENIFLEEKNYVHFLKLAKTHLLQVSDFYSYCLLPNHFHFLIRIKNEADIDIKYKERIHQPFSNFFNAYTKSINKEYKRVGSLFQKHPKRIEIKNENYLKNLIVYINTNPDHHEICDFKKYKFSSYKSLVSDKSTNLKRLEIIQLFDGLDNFKYVHQSKKINLELIKDVVLE